jgi:hypothetical protein
MAIINRIQSGQSFEHRREWIHEKSYLTVGGLKKRRFQDSSRSDWEEIACGPFMSSVCSGLP